MKFLFLVPPYFQAALLVGSGAGGIVYWQARESFGGEDDSWIEMGDPYLFFNRNGEKAEWHYFTLPVDQAHLLYSMNIYGSGDFRFGLIPSYN